MKNKEYIKVHGFSLLILAITIAVSSFIGSYVGRTIPIPKEEAPLHDTIYLRPSLTDSLLLDISDQLRDINSKIIVKKPLRKTPLKRDSIKIDATIHLDYDKEKQ